MICALVAAALTLPSPGGFVVTASGGRPLGRLEAARGFGAFDVGATVDLFRQGVVVPGLFARFRAITSDAFEMSLRLGAGRAIPLPEAAEGIRRVVGTWDADAGVRADLSLPGHTVAVAQVAGIAVSDLTAEHSSVLLQLEGGLDWGPLPWLVVFGRVGRLSGARRAITTGSLGAGVRF